MEKAVNEFAKLPGIGVKTAMRLVLHLLRQDVQSVESFGEALITLKKEVKYCSVCHNISDTDVCGICSDMQRDRSVVCVVENIQDVMAIENTHQYRGVYHVLGGKISPIDGVGPSDLTISRLVERVKALAGAESQVEVIFALSGGVEGETTAFYIYRQLSCLGIRVSSIARGLGFGDELEYADELTLGRSIVNRQEFHP